MASVHSGSANDVLHFAVFHRRAVPAAAVPHRILSSDLGVEKVALAVEGVVLPMA